MRECIIGVPKNMNVFYKIEEIYWNSSKVPFNFYIRVANVVADHDDLLTQ